MSGAKTHKHYKKSLGLRKFLSMLLMSEPLTRNMCPVTKSYLTVCDIHGLRLPCPSLFPGGTGEPGGLPSMGSHRVRYDWSDLAAAAAACLLSQWCYLTISSFANPFSFCPQSFPASGSFPVSQPFTSSGQSIGASASASVLPMNIQGWFPLRIDWLISLQSKKTLKSLLQHHNLKVSVLAHLASFIVLLSYLYMTTGKTIPLTIWSFVSEVIFAF